MLRVYVQICTILEKLTEIICLSFMAVIVVAMAGQVFFRYVLNVPLAHTDEVSLMALTWLTFIGAAWIYRRREHITVELIAQSTSVTAIKKALDIFGQVVVAVVLIIILSQVLELLPRAMKLKLGTLELSRFTMHYLPLLLGCVLIILFALEHILKVLYSVPEHKPDPTATATE